MKFKLWLNIITFAAIILVIFFAWNDIVLAFHTMINMNIWILLLIVPVQFFSFYCLAKLYSYFFKSTGVEITDRQLFAPMMELNFVNHVFPSGGASGFSYLTLRLKPHDISTAKSTLAQLARFVFTFIAYVVLMLISLFLLALQGSISPMAILAVASMTFTAVFLILVIIFIVGKEARINSFTSAAARWINKVIHIFRKKNPEVISLKKVRDVFLELHEDFLLVKKNWRAMRPVFAWAFVNCLAELLMLYLAFVAAGSWVNPGGVLIAMVIANLAGLVAVLPGGIGLYEPLLAAVLISGGIPGALALSATLVYRVITLITSMAAGYLLYQKTISKHGSSSTTSQ